MSNPLQKKIKAIDVEVQLLHYKWKYFMQLFGNKERVALLNATAPLFFRCVEDSILCDLLLSIARLIDPPKSSGKENLSFENIIAETKDDSLRSEVSKLISELKAKTEAIKVWRKKKLAHNDLLQAVNGVPLPPLQVTELTGTLAVIRQIMNIFHRRLSNTTVLYEICFASDPGDGDTLLFYLKYGSDTFKDDMKNLAMLKSREVRKWLAMHNQKSGES